MKPKGLLIAVVLLAVLGGVVWWSNKKQAKTAAKGTDTSTKILTIPDDQFQEIQIKKVTGEVIDLDARRRQVAHDRAQAAAGRSGRGRVDGDEPVVAERRQGDRGEGRRPEAVRAGQIRRSTSQVKRKDGKTDELLIGDDTPTGSGAYAKLANDPRVFTVASFVKTSLDKRPDDLRDKRLLTFDQDKLTRVELQAKGQAVEFGKNAQNEWQILKPRPLRADSSAVDGLVDKLKDAKMDLTATGGRRQGVRRRRRRWRRRRSPTRAARRRSRSARTKTRTSTPRARRWRASTRSPPMSATRSTRAWTISATRRSSISASAIPSKVDVKGAIVHQERRQVDVRRQDHGQRQRPDPDRQAARSDAPPNSSKRAAASRSSRPP